MFLFPSYLFHLVSFFVAIESVLFRLLLLGMTVYKYSTVSRMFLSFSDSPFALVWFRGLAFHTCMEWILSDFIFVGLVSLDPG